MRTLFVSAFATPVPPVARIAVRVSCVVLAYALLAVFFTWPLATRLDNAVTSAIDPVDSIWRIGWAHIRLLSDPARLFAGNTFYPFPDTYLFDECLIGVAVLTLPLAVVGVPPIAVYNLAVLLTLTLCGTTMYALARRFGAVPLAAFAAGMIYAFAPLHLDRVGHIGVLSIQWFPLILLLLDMLIERPHVWKSATLAAALTMQVLSSQYHAVYLVILVPLFLAVMLAHRQEARRWAVIGHLAVAGALALAIVAPVVLAYVRVQREFDVSRTYNQTAYYSASLASFVTTDGQNRLWGPLTAPLRAYGTYTFERGMFAGLFAFACAVVGVWIGRRRAWVQFLVLLGLVAAVFALGPELRLAPGTKESLFRPLPYGVLYFRVPGFDSMRVPARIGVLYLLAVAALAAVALSALSARLATIRWSRPRFVRMMPMLAVAVVLLGIGAEYAKNPLTLVPLEHAETIPPMYRWLAQQPPDTIVVELPLHIPDHEREQRIAVRQQYYSLFHRRRVVGGNANVVPKGFKAVVQEMRHLPSSRALALLEGLNISYVVIHYDQMPRTAAQRLRDQIAMEAQGTLTPEATFGETVVYRLTATAHFAALRAAVPPTATVLLSRNDPLKFGSYAAMIGYVLRGNPLYTNLRVDFGTDYRPAHPKTEQYDYAVLFKGEDPASVGFTGARVIWEDGVMQVFSRQ